MRVIEWESSLLEPLPTPALEARFRRETGRPGGVMRFFEGSDWLTDAVVRLSVQLGTCVELEPDLADQAGLVVSQDNSCRFCFGAQRMLLRGLGMSEARISRLEHELLVGDFTPRDRAALAFARRLSRAQPRLSPEDLDALREAGFSEIEIAELAAHIALHLFFNRTSTFIALPTRTIEELPDLWWMRLLGPAIRPLFQRMRKQGRSTALEPAQKTGPFSEIINGLDGLPVAGELRAVVDGALASDSLSPRAGPLAFAVISRALGCPASESESRRLLAERGLDDEVIESLLTHLSSPALSEIEEIVVTFARETVWYVPARIQQRCHALRDQLSREQLLDLVGITSLANSICRLAIVSGHCD
jgi:AhpD family alkylhydroperoxidase